MRYNGCFITSGNDSGTKSISGMKCNHVNGKTWVLLRWHEMLQWLRKSQFIAEIIRYITARLNVTGTCEVSQDIVNM